MKKVGILLLIAVLAMAAWVVHQYPGEATPPGVGSEAEAATTTVAARVKLASDLYPLYENATWSEPALEQFKIGTTTYDGASAYVLVATSTMNPSTVFTPFENYYARRLSALGWTIANDLAAGGHTGGQTGYRKDSTVILTRFSIDYHTVPTNAPSECPCAVTLSVFSGR